MTITLVAAAVTPATTAGACVSDRTYDRTTKSAIVTVYSTGADPWRY
jgi:hypothetical protein